VIHDGMTCDSSQGQGHRGLKWPISKSISTVNMHVIKDYSGSEL